MVRKTGFGSALKRRLGGVALGAAGVLTMLSPNTAHATNFTTTVPGTAITLPDDYPEAGGVAIVLVGANGNIYYQFSDPNGAFRGFQFRGSPSRFNGNPFTINDPLTLNCGFSDCATYFGGSIAQLHVRFSAYDGDTQVGGFDRNDITLRMNGFDVGNWSDIRTEKTDDSGTQSFGFEQGFGNNSFNTGWFSSSNPALLNNILTTGQTTTQVFDRDPNDNYWDFRRGESLGNNNIVTVAPGYNLEKTADRATFSAVGEVVTFTYTVTNIGSVPIRDLSVVDDKIANVTCDRSVILDVNPGQQPQAAICTGQYTITQDDYDAQSVTNIAQANGDPDVGVLGTLTDSVTLTGPAGSPAMIVEKSATLAAFGAVGTQVPYTIEVTNTGDVTLRDIQVSDSLVPNAACPIPDLAPGATGSCQVTYTVTQADLDRAALGPTVQANWLANTATVTAAPPSGPRVSGADSVALPAQAITPGVALEKSALATGFETLGETLDYTIRLTNTGNVSYAIPVVNDSLTGVAACPAGTLAPGGSVVCTASYTVTQDDLDRGTLTNTADTSVTVAGQTATAQDNVTLTATQTLLAVLDKTRSGGVSQITAIGDQIDYSYAVTNTGNVRLTDISITDDKIALVTCPAGPVLPGDTVTCQGSYTATQEDLNAGGVTNTATATLSATGLPDAMSNSDQVMVPAAQSPAMTLTKTARAFNANRFQVGNRVRYDFVVTNTGNIDLTQATTGQTRIQVTDDKIGTFNCVTLPLLVGEQGTCSRAYTLTADDVLAGAVVNEATATVGSVTSDTVTEQVSPNFSPAVTLSKTTSTASVSALTDTISYTFTVTNTGDSQILAAQPITINDPDLDAPADCSAQPAILNSGDSFQCTGTQSNLSQSAFDSGEIRNTATASFPFTNNGVTIPVTSAPSTATVPVVAAPAVQLTKTGPANFSAADEIITYSFSVENTGNVTLGSIAVSDPLIPGLTCAISDLAPGASDSCTGNYQITQTQFDLGSLANTATVTAVPATGGSVTDQDTHSIARAGGAGVFDVSFDKTADLSSFGAVGDQITYTLSATNTGTLTIPEMVLTDALVPGYQCTIRALAPGQTNDACTVSYTVTQADLDAGQVVNTAQLTSATAPNRTDQVTVTGPARSASYMFDKRADGPFSAIGDTVTYSFVLTNTGNVTLTNLAVTDPFFGTPVSCTVPSLAPGATDQSCQATYSITQADLDRGSLSNTASVAVDVPPGVTDPGDQTSTVTVAGPAEAPALQVVKTPSQPGFAAPTDSLTYDFAVTNSGNVTLSGLTLTDADLGFSCSLAPLPPGASTTTCADTTPLRATRAFGQSDVDAGFYTNTVVVTGETQGQGTPVTGQANATVTGPQQSPTISLAKTSPDGAGFDTLGQRITFDFTVTNTGNITLTAPISVSDPMVPNATCPANPGLAPGGSLVCQGTYQVTQADLDRGQILNTATASLRQPVVPTTPGGASSIDVISPPAQATVPAAQGPQLSLNKRLEAGQSASFANLGDTVRFEYIVTNTGNVTLADPVTVTDDKIPGTLTCTTGPLAPGASATCAQTWTATQADLDTGTVTNTATANTVFDGAPVVSNADTATVAASQTPELSMEKSFASTSAPGFFNANDVLTFDLIIRNTGNVTVDGPFVVTDSLTTPVCAAPPAQLAPGQQFACIATYTVQGSDVALGAVVNTAFATGTFDGVPVRTPDDDAIYPVDASPALDLTKEVLPANASFASVGQTLTYRYTYTNTGNVGLAGEILVLDDKIGTRTCRAVNPTLPLATGASGTCEFDYTVTQEDLDRAEVTNVAVGRTIYTDPNGTSIVSSQAQTVTVAAATAPALTVAKTQTPAVADAGVGDSLPFRIVATNTGNQTLSAVSVEDLLLPGLTCTVAGQPAPANVVLAPQEALVCAGAYTVAQSDVDAQSLTNTATAQAVTPQGAPQQATDTVVTPLVPAITTLVVEKTAPTLQSGETFSAVGQTIPFSVSVTNTGNVTLTSATVTDTRPVSPASCAVGPLAPGETDDTCLFTYTVTQADLDAQNEINGQIFGGFVNTAQVVGTFNDPGATQITATDDLFVRGPLREPGFSLVKSADLSAISVFGERVTYTYTVANTGNVTLTEVPTIDDDKIGTFACAGLPQGGLLPNEFYTCTAPYSVTQADLDAGSVTNVATVLSGEVPPGDPSAQDSVTLPATQAPAVVVEKTASLSAPGVGQTVRYSYLVRNTGNLTLRDLTLSDSHISASGTITLAPDQEQRSGDALPLNDSTDATANDGTWDILRPGDSVTFIAEYTVTQADVDAQTPLRNTVTLSGRDATGAQVSASDTLSVQPQGPAPELAVIKVLDDSGVSTPPTAGDVVRFDITVTNSGNQTLTTLQLADTMRRADGSRVPAVGAPGYVSGDAGSDGQMAPGEAWIYRFDHALTQADIDAGGISNQIVATALSPSNTPVIDRSDDGTSGTRTDSPTQLSIPSFPAISGQKVLRSGVPELGALQVFAIEVTNTGNVTLTDVGIDREDLTRADGAVLVPDSGPDFDGSTQGSPQGRLLPGETATYLVRYALIQADIDAGGIRNQATVVGQPPVGTPIRDLTDDGDDTDGNADDDLTEVPVPAAPALSLVKALAPTAPVTFDTVGQPLEYVFTVTNSGNVTLRDAITVADPLITDAGGAVTCAPLPGTGLAPGAAITCTGSYLVTQADLDAGQIDNSATASDGTVTSDPSITRILSTQTPALELVKTAETVAATDFVVGAEVTYTYTATNTGNVTLTDPIQISDNLIPDTAITCPVWDPAGLAPLGSYTCTGRYTVTADDVDLGSVTNLASGTSGQVASPPVIQTIPEAAVPALSVTKTAEANASFDEVGDTLTYTFTVTNSGTRAFVRDVVVQDDKLGPVTCFAPTPAQPDFRAGQTVSCQGTYTVVQEDLDAGQVTNTAYAQTLFGSGPQEVVSAPVDVTVTAQLTPDLSLTKTATPATVQAVGDVVRFDLVAENTGNQTLRSITVTDPMLPDLSCSAETLERGQTLTCGADYTVTQADLDRGTLSNTAEATAITPQDTRIGTTGTAQVTLPAATPAIVLSKTTVPDRFGAVGTTLDYVLSVENTGNVSLTAVTLSDPMAPSLSCVIPNLAPGARDDSCRFAIPVTQAMVDAGEQSNTASVTATPPNGPPTTTSVTRITQGPARDPALRVTKVVTDTGRIAGDQARFAIAVENTGNVTLSNLRLTDTMTTLTGRTVTLDAPPALQSGDSNGNGALDVGETWIFDAARTLTQADVNDGGLRNQVTATAEAPGGGTVSDVSDNGNPLDGNTQDDPTEAVIPAGPALKVVKSVETPAAAVGDTVVFRIDARNTGNVDLTDVQITDSMTRLDGTSVPATVVVDSLPVPLSPGDSATWTVSRVVTQADLDAGGFQNVAVVQGFSPTREPASDVSENEDPFDGNAENDPTEAPIVPMPGLTVIKTTTSIGTAAGEPVSWEVTAQNTGNVTLTDVTLTDTLTDLNGETPRSLTLTFDQADSSSAEGTLLPGETARYTVGTTLTQADIDSGGVRNVVTGAALTPTSQRVTDRSDDDGVNDDDPTVSSITARPSFDIRKTASVPTFLFPTVEQRTFDITVTNTGNVTQTGIQVIDDLAAFVTPATLLGTAYPVRVTAQGFDDGGANPAYDGVSTVALLTGNPTLAPGATAVIRVTATYLGTPGAPNTASVTSTQLGTPTTGEVTVITRDDDGDGIPNLVEGTGDRDRDGTPNASDFDPTGYFYCEADGRILTGGTISVSGNGATQSGVGTSGPITILRDGREGDYQFHVTQSGRYTLALTYPSVGAPSDTRQPGGVLDLTSRLPENPAVLGGGETGQTGVLSDFSASANPFFLTFDIEAGDPYLIGNNIPLQACAEQADIQATKAADRTTAVFGETVNYTLTFTNSTLRTFADARITDLLPEGMLYTPGSARIDGTAQEPAAPGRRLEWRVTIAPSQVIRLTFAARVAGNGSYGTLTNQTWMSTAIGRRMSNIATADVRIDPEAVFECTDIIGKVFDDKNHNGYQDGPDSLAVVRDDALFVGSDGKGGKLMAPPKALNRTEPGLPGVRLAAPNGTLITTDAHGRYSVPCAALPRDIGSNFILKLDTRTLPTGYRVTTENPRVIRVTPGKMAKLNFGATLGKLAEVDLNARAFTGTRPSAALERGVAQMLQQIGTTPYTLRLTYLLAKGEDRSEARARLDAVKRLIETGWQGPKRALVIETNLTRVQ